MPARRSEPWSFEDGPEVADRILCEYARWLLDSLPYLPEMAEMSADLIEGYGRLDAARAKAANKLRAHHSRCLATTREELEREARIAESVWDVVHRYLVASEFHRLQSSCDATDELRMALLAERAVEQLVRDK